MKNTMTVNEIEVKIETLTTQRKAWESGTCKASNEELYQLLSDCFDFYSVLVASVEQRKALFKYLDARGLKYNKSSSLPTRIVRAVFGDCGKRAYAYARVIEVALDLKTDKETMQTFIVNSGGIEQIRRKVDGISPAEKRKALKTYSENFLSSCEPIVSTKVATSSTLQPNKKASNNFFLALMRTEEDGSNSIVFGTNNETLVDSVLVEAGKTEGATKKMQQKQKMESKRKTAQHAAINKIDFAA